MFLLATLLNLIANQKEKRGTKACLAQNFRIFISKIFDFLFRKRVCSLKTAVHEFSIFHQSTSLLLTIFLKFLFKQQEERGFIKLKTFKFLFQKHSTSYS